MLASRQQIEESDPAQPDYASKLGARYAQHPVYSPERHTDFIWMAEFGNHTVELNSWFPVGFLVGCAFALVGLWTLWIALAWKRGA